MPCAAAGGQARPARTRRWARTERVAEGTACERSGGAVLARARNKAREEVEAEQESLEGALLKALQLC